MLAETKQLWCVAGRPTGVPVGGEENRLHQPHQRGSWLPLLFACTASTLLCLNAVGQSIPPDDPGPGHVHFSIDATQSVKPISPYIYGANQYASSVANVGMTRLGGNRWTGFNWETNESHAGADWYHHNDCHLGCGPPGSAVLPTLQQAATGNYATVVTVPMAGYVAADSGGTVDESEISPSSRFHVVEAKKSTIYPGSPLSLNPNESDGYVFTDEFVNWVEQTKQSDQTVFYSLDNEPGLWGETLPPGWQSGQPPSPWWDPSTAVSPSPEGRTHPTIHPYEPTFAEMRTRTIEHASAIKDVNPSALVFGGVGYGYNEFTTLQNAPDAGTSPAHPGGDEPGEMHYYEWLLREVAREEATQGRTLVDVIDLHWYPEAQGSAGRITNNDNSPGQVAARVQAPRSLWDSSYAETSWITQWVTQGPIELLPRLQRDIDDFKPDTKIAITEYNFGGSNHISGAIAQADFLGLMGEYGVFASSWWALQSEANSQFVLAAFDMFLDYDGAGSTFGDTSIYALTDDDSKSAIYASRSAENPDEMILVAINRTGSPLDAAISIADAQRYDSVDVYQLTGSQANSVHAGQFAIDLTNAFQYTLPAYSVSTLRLTVDKVAGDFNGDGLVNLADYTVWRDTLGSTMDLRADANGDQIVNVADYSYWKLEFGKPWQTNVVALVPEPAAGVLLVAASVVLIGRRIGARDKLARHVALFVSDHPILV